MRVTNFVLLVSLSWAISDTFLVNVSAEVQSEIIQTDTNHCGLISDAEPDEFEPDNTFSNAIYGDLPVLQCHTLHESNDCDWVRFFADSNEVYAIETVHLGTNLTIDTVIEIYREDTSLFADPFAQPVLIDSVDDSGREEGETITLHSNSVTRFTTGFYYARVCQYSGDPEFEAGSYRLEIFVPAGPEGITVWAWDLSTQTPMIGASVSVTGAATASGTIGSTGFVKFPSLLPGNYSVEVSAADTGGRPDYMPLFDPFRSGNVASNPASDYGNPRNLGQVEFAQGYSTLAFGFNPVAYVDAVLRDAITGAPVPGMELQITQNNAPMTVYSKKPWASYGEPMISSTNGSFGDCAPIPSSENYKSFTISDSESRYETKVCVLNRSSPAQGGVLNLADIWLEPETSGNGIPDVWEIANGITNVSGSSTNDIDGDGLSIWQEYIAGTSPTNSSHVFRMERKPSGVQGEFTLTWDTAPRRIYAISKTTDFEGDASWIEVHNVTNTENEATMSWMDPDSTNENNAAYRINVTGIGRANNGP